MAWLPILPFTAQGCRDKNNYAASLYLLQLCPDHGFGMSECYFLCTATQHCTHSRGSTVLAGLKDTDVVRITLQRLICKLLQVFDLTRNANKLTQLLASGINNQTWRAEQARSSYGFSSQIRCLCPLFKAQTGYCFIGCIYRTLERPVPSQVYPSFAGVQ